MELANGVSHTERLRANLTQLRQALERAQADGATPADVAELLKALRRSRRRLREAKESPAGLPVSRLAAIRPL